MMKRLVICRGIYCNQGKRADKNFRYLKPKLDKLNEGGYPPRIQVEFVNCLSMCGAGPNLVLYPDRVKCHHANPEKLQGFVKKYLQDDYASTEG